MTKKITVFFYILCLFFSFSVAEAKKKPKDIDYVSAKLIYLDIVKDKIGTMGLGTGIAGVGGIGAALDIRMEHYDIRLVTQGRVYYIVFPINTAKAKKYRPNWAVGDTLQVAFDEEKSNAYMKLFGSKRNIKGKILKRVKR